VWNSPARASVVAVLCDGSWRREETGVVLAALSRSVADGDAPQVSNAVERGARWLIEATAGGAETAATPLGLYFARLWYYEELYPVVFALAGLAGAAAVFSTSRRANDSASRFAALQVLP
jgi:hypothetical protein